MKYAIDGSNVLLGLRLNKKPSERLFARLLAALAARGDECQVFFDNSIKPKMAQQGLSAEWRLLESSLVGAGVAPLYASRADPLIEAYCKSNGAAVINSGDKMDSWNTRPSQIHRARVHRNRNMLQLALIDDATGKFVFHVSAHDQFEFGGVQFPALNAQNTTVESMIAPDTQYSSVAAEGTLLVFALDASGSMAQTNSFDGRPKSDHLNDIVKKAIARLRSSRIGEGLYVAVLRFENDVTPLSTASGAAFSSVNDWFSGLSTFNYLDGVTLGQTNIRLALQKSKELIQNTLADTDSVSALADSWRACVILVTDGNHYVVKTDGSVETDAEVALQALDIHEGLKGLIGSRIDVGCVGIGTDLNRELLKNIASLCTPTQKGMAARAGIGPLLQDNRLFIVVDSSDNRFGEAIRTFIDVASGSA